MKILEEIKKSDLCDSEIEELDEFTVSLVAEYVTAEHRFLDLVFELSDQEGMTKEDAKGYIAYLGSLRLAQLGLMPYEQVPENPLPWMDYVLSGSKHVNFFESRVVDYTHSGLKGSVDYSDFKNLLEERMV